MSERDALVKRLQEIRGCAQKFVDKVLSGRAVSKETYSDMLLTIEHCNAAISALTQPEAQGEPVARSDEDKARLEVALTGSTDKPLAWVRADGRLCKTKADDGFRYYPLHYTAPAVPIDEQIWVMERVVDGVLPDGSRESILASLKRPQSIMQSLDDLGELPEPDWMRGYRACATSQKKQNTTSQICDLVDYTDTLRAQYAKMRVDIANGDYVKRKYYDESQRRITELESERDEFRRIAWDWGQGVTDAETAIRKLHAHFPIDAAAGKGGE